MTPVTDHNPVADVLRPCLNYWHPHCQHCRHCEGCIRGRSLNCRSKRRDTKYCSVRCRVAACRKRRSGKPIPTTGRED